jgi:hypothetical protein
MQGVWRAVQDLLLLLRAQALRTKLAQSNI